MANLYIRYNQPRRNFSIPYLDTSMTSLKQIILDQIRVENEKYTYHSNEELHGLLFLHRNSLRLSYTGYLILKKVFTAYSFDLGVPLNAGHLIALNKMEYPYFITRNRLILFSEVDATVVTLAGGVDRFLEISFQAEK